MNAYERMAVRLALNVQPKEKKPKYDPAPLDLQRAADEREIERLAIMSAYRTATHRSEFPLTNVSLVKKA